MSLQSCLTMSPDWLRSSISRSLTPSHDLVKRREGLVLKWYKDSLGKLTAGYGHLQKPGEASLVVTKALADAWFEGDIGWAEDAALRQSLQLPFVTQDLLDKLVSVNFQLGAGWTGTFKKTWALLLAGKYAEAAREAEDSNWHKQTPVRVRDFQEALWRTQTLYDLYKG
ncbi:lysozyme [Pseudomonas tolaasii]|uniref:Lysozyme n=2 Tax=root TaxID=1 RepID=K0IMR6_9CAUD|nr:lysozyme [Pseudomonas phage UFV-P2]AFU62918.2 lysozyme [Pseudomonas phage UFV-P2]ARB31559.1 lysozyme [Pseudomonas tolaasii]